MICERDGGDLVRTCRLGAARFEAAVRREILRRGGQKPSLRIVRRLFTALTDPAGVIAHRPGAMEQVAFLLQDWQAAGHKLTDTETRMVAVLDELQLTGLVTSITGISPVGAAAILAETGVRRERQATLHKAYEANPLRFGHRRPEPPKMPAAAWINQPSREALIQSS